MAFSRKGVESTDRPEVLFLNLAYLHTPTRPPVSSLPPEGRHLVGSSAETSRPRWAVASGESSTDQPVLVVDGVARDFGGVQAVADASFCVPPGALYGLIGPNGAGKSTLLNILAGAVTSTAGTVRYQGEDITHIAPYIRARRGLIRTFQLSREFGRLTVLENLLVAAQGLSGESFRSVFGRRARTWRQQESLALARARGLLARFGLESKENEYAGELSGGQKRIIEILRAVMAGPQLLLLDEPLAGINPRIADDICAYLQELRRGGLTMLMVEHEFDRVEALCDSVVVMVQGSVIFEGDFRAARQQEEVIRAYVAG
jgi:neutral amino acid transport system ATP-binding protein